MEALYQPRVDLEAMLDPEAPGWQRVRPEAVSLIGTPAGLQPTEAIRVKWTGKKIGAVERVEVSAIHDGRVLALRLDWSDPSENRQLSDTDAFSDAAAILFPVHAGAPIATMGAPGLAVNAWYWRADSHGIGRHVVAEGLGTTRTIDDKSVQARGTWKEGHWRVVVARALRIATAEPVVQLAPGQSTRFGVAVWEGSHQERAGIKAFSGDWLDFVLAPEPGTRSH